MKVDNIFDITFLKRGRIWHCIYDHLTKEILFDEKEDKMINGGPLYDKEKEEVSEAIHQWMKNHSLMKINLN